MAQRLGLTARERRGLAQALAQCQEARHYRRLLALQELDRGRPIAAVARSLEVSRQSVHTWIQTYRRTRSFAALADRPRSGRPSRWNEALRSALEAWLEHSPQRYGYPATVWTVPLLREQLRHAYGQSLADATVRRELHALGYTWKRARYRLVPDPARGKKAAPPVGSSGAPGAPQRGAGSR